MVYWDSGLRYDNQRNYKITLDDVRCTRGEWESCEYTEDVIGCYHEEDVFLSCHGNLLAHWFLKNVNTNVNIAI